MTNRVAEGPEPVPEHARDRVAIIDTNIVVSGLIASAPSSPVTRIVDGMHAARFSFAASEPLIAEYRNVLVRPLLARHHGLSPSEVEAFVIGLLRHAVVLAGGAGPPAPDPGDQFLWDLLSSRADLVLVTGDELLLADAGMSGRVIGAADRLS